MKENQAKLNLLREEIENCSEKEAAALVEAAEKSAEETVSALEKELSAKRSGNIRRITEDFRTAERKRVSETCFRENRRVLLRRNELTEEFFSAVKEKLVTLTETPRYTAYLSASAERAEKEMPLDEKTKVLCRECDTAALVAILKGKNCALEAVKNIEIGGIMVSCPEKGIILDLTLDSALEAEREGFSALKEMQL